MDRKKEIGERIKTMRTSRNMSQINLANALHCGQSTIAMYETGKRMPDIETVDFLADIFNVPPYSILYSENEIESMISNPCSLSSEENRLIAAYRAADPSARKYALQILENNPAVDTQKSLA